MQIEYSPTFRLRFWAKVDCSGGAASCWIWRAATARGRGYIQIGRRGAGLVMASRASWEMANGPIPEGLEVCHNCPGGDNPLCVNPAHLYLGTHAINMADAAQKAQMRRGEGRPDAKLTEMAVREMRRLHRAGVRTKELALRFGVGRKTAYNAITGRTWRHVG